MKLCNELRVILSTRIMQFTNSDLPLKDVILSRAYFSTFLSQTMAEISESFPITVDSHIGSFIVFFLFWTFLSVINKKNETTIDRLQHIIEYPSIRKNTSRILFVLYILFCKNVDNAI